MAHAMSRVSLSTARPSDAQFAFVSHNPGNSDVQLYCHLFRARHARAVSLSVAKSSLFYSRVRLQSITFSCVCNVFYYKELQCCFWKYEHIFYLFIWLKCLQFCSLKCQGPVPEPAAVPLFSTVFFGEASRWGRGRALGQETCSKAIAAQSRLPPQRQCFGVLPQGPDSRSAAWGKGLFCSSSMLSAITRKIIILPQFLKLNNKHRFCMYFSWTGCLGTKSRAREQSRGGPSFSS